MPPHPIAAETGAGPGGCPCSAAGIPPDRAFPTHPCQFVPFRDYVDRTGNHVLSMARLARDVLAEIPDQLVSYMKAQGIRPRPPPATPASPLQSPARTPPASPKQASF